MKGFRHLVRHAYDIEFREDRVQELAALAGKLSARLPAWTAEFGARVRREQGWS